MLQNIFSRCGALHIEYIRVCANFVTVLHFDFILQKIAHDEDFQVTKPKIVHLMGQLVSYCEATDMALGKEIERERAIKFIYKVLVIGLCMQPLFVTLLAKGLWLQQM